MNQDHLALPFSFNVNALPDALVVSLSGSLSDENNRKAKEEFLQVLKTPPRRMVIDLSSIDYVSSSGIALLVSILCRCRQLSCGMRICGLRPDTRELFRLTKLNQVFEIFEDIRAAVDTK